MKAPPPGAPDLSRFRPAAVLKSDHFSTVERGFWRTDKGEVEAVRRRFDEVPWWLRRRKIQLRQAVNLDP
jgi:hypothetical protein